MFGHLHLLWTLNHLGSISHSPRLHLCRHLEPCPVRPWSTRVHLLPYPPPRLPQRPPRVVRNKNLEMFIIQRGRSKNGPEPCRPLRPSPTCSNVRPHLLHSVVIEIQPLHPSKPVPRSMMVSLDQYLETGSEGVRTLIRYFSAVQDLDPGSVPQP
jgi:hypothetical protein